MYDSRDLWFTGALKISTPRFPWILSFTSLSVKPCWIPLPIHAAILGQLSVHKAKQDGGVLFWNVLLRPATLELDDVRSDLPAYLEHAWKIQDSDAQFLVGLLSDMFDRAFLTCASSSWGSHEQTESILRILLLKRALNHLTHVLLQEWLTPSLRPRSGLTHTKILVAAKRK